MQTKSHLPAAGVRFFFCLVLLVGTLGCEKSSPQSGGMKYDLPERGICAHRGARSTHPENTLPAFREAVRLGAHMIEFDVRMSRDGELVIMHDATVDRTTNGSGKVSDLTLAELKSLDAGAWKGPRFAGTRIPTLAEALEIMPKNVWLNIHLKGGKRLGEKVAEIVARTGRIHQAFLACKRKAASAAKKVDGRIMICNMERQSDTRQYVNETIAMGADFIQLLHVRARDGLAEYVKRLKKAGIRINYYGTNSPEELRKLFEAGVDFPLVDDVERMVRAASELGIPPLKPQFR